LIVDNYANQWVVFDIEHVYLLLSWIFVVIPVILIDPEAAYAIPEGIMHVRVNQFLSNSGVASWYEQYFESQPQRQLVLVQLHHFETFLKCLRLAMFANGVHILPGEVFHGTPCDDSVFNDNGEHIGTATYDPELTAKTRSHGLSIQVYASSTYPKHRMKRLLEKSRTFHGRLNEVTITGSTDPSQERSIEASITAPSDAQNTSFHELVLQPAELANRAGGHVSNGTWICAFVLSRMALSMMVNYYHADNFVTPWSGKLKFSGPHADFSTRRFEAMMLVVPYLNFIFASIPEAREVVYFEDAD
jgi:hypothetical protein